VYLQNVSAKLPSPCACIGKTINGIAFLKGIWRYWFYRKYGLEPRNRKMPCGVSMLNLEKLERLNRKRQGVSQQPAATT
jgi:hypothetical protein